MKKLITSFVAVVSILAGSFGAWTALPVLAYSPTLSIYSNGANNGTVALNISGAQPNSTVTIYYYTSANPNQAIVAGTFGTTDYSGNFSGSEQYGNDAQSGITGRYALIGNDKTNTVNSSSYSYGNNGGGGNNYGSGGVIFSNNTPTITVGQTLNITLSTSYNNGGYNYGYGNSSFYISSNSNSSVASAVISGSSLTVYGVSNGSTSISVCSSQTPYGSGYNNGYGSNCSTLYVTVNGNYGGGNGLITFAQNNVTLSVGQSFNDAIYSNNNSYGNFYVISSSSNNSVVSANISGSTLQIYAISAGSATIGVCSTAVSNGYGYGYNSNCGTVYVSVTGNGGTTYGNIVANPSNPYMSYGQSLSIILSQTSYNGYSNGFYISSNTNPSIVSASITGSTLLVYAANYGTDVITVCGNNSSAYNNSGMSNCLSITITVNGAGTGTGGVLTFAQGNVTMSSGQSYSDAIYNTGSYSYGSLYISSNTNSAVVSATISNNSLQLYANAAGNSTVEVCSSANGYMSASCGYVYVIVNGSGIIGNSNAVTFSNANPTVAVGQSSTVNLYAISSYGTIPSFYIATNPNTSVVNAVISGSTVQLYGVAPGTVTLNICASNPSVITSPVCGNLYVTVSGNGGGQVLGSSVYANGQLIQEGQQISIVYRNTKSPFANYPAFTGFGFKLSNVLNVGVSNLAQSGHIVSSAYGAHPWGSWIKNGNTVYFVSEYGLIPIADYQTFINNGGQDLWVVQANSYDMQLPLQSVMGYNDSRLR